MTDSSSSPQTPEIRLRGWIGDACAVGAVLLGAGVFGGLVWFGPVLGGPFIPGGPIGGPEGMPPGGAPGGGLRLSLWGVLSALVLAAAMLVRRRWPRIVFGLSAVVLCGSLLWGAPVLGAGVATTIAAYALAFRAPRRELLWWAGGVTALIGVLAVAIAGWTGVDWRVLQLGTAVVVAAALGDSAKSRHDALLASIERAERAEQGREQEVRQRIAEERLQIARDLHDTVAHRISVINLQAGAATGFIDSDPRSAQQALGTIRESARGALQEIGQLLRFLRDDPSHADGSPVTSQEATVPPQDSDAVRRPHTLADLPELIERVESAGVRVLQHTNGDLTALPERDESVVYRVVQEGLTNVLKHGAGEEAVLELDYRDGLVSIIITNPVSGATDGGNPGENRLSGTGLGLVGVRERVAALQGEVHTRVSAGRHILHAQFPSVPAQMRAQGGVQVQAQVQTHTQAQGEANAEVQGAADPQTTTGTSETGATPS